MDKGIKIFFLLRKTHQNNSNNKDNNDEIFIVIDSNFLDEPECEDDLKSLFSMVEKDVKKYLDNGQDDSSSVENEGEEKMSLRFTFVVRKDDSNESIYDLYRKYGIQPESMFVGQKAPLAMFELTNLQAYSRFINHNSDTQNTNFVSSPRYQSTCIPTKFSYQNRQTGDTFNLLESNSDQSIIFISDEGSKLKFFLNYFFFMMRLLLSSNSRGTNNKGERNLNDTISIMTHDFLIKEEPESKHLEVRRENEKQITSLKTMKVGTFEPHSWAQ